MESIQAYHKDEQHASEILEGLHEQFQNIHVTLSLIRELVSLTEDEKAAALVRDMSEAAIGPMYRIRNQLNVPY